MAKAMARRTQHRSRRDTNTQDTTELKQQIRILKRQLARANKEIQRLGEEDDDAPQQEEKVAVAEKQAKCPECGSTDLGVLETPAGKTITSCKTCKKWRKVA